MKSASVIAAAITLLLHAALFVAVVAEFSATQKHPASPTPVIIKLPPVETPAPLPVAPAPSAPAKMRPEPQPRAKPKPSAQPHDATASQVNAPEVSFESKPSVSNTTAVPAAPVAAPPTSSAPAAKTSVSDATYASTNRKPPYPRMSRSNDESGTVILRVLVKADGTAGAVEVKTSSGYARLDESARSTVQTWRFKPATVDGTPVEEWYQVAIPFTLQNN